MSQGGKPSWTKQDNARTSALIKKTKLRGWKFTSFFYHKTTGGSCESMGVAKWTGRHCPRTKRDVKSKIYRTPCHKESRLTSRCHWTCFKVNTQIQPSPRYQNNIRPQEMTGIIKQLNDCLYKAPTLSSKETRIKVEIVALHNLLFCLINVSAFVIPHCVCTEK